MKQTFYYNNWVPGLWKVQNQ